MGTFSLTKIYGTIKIKRNRLFGECETIAEVVKIIDPPLNIVP